MNDELLFSLGVNDGTHAALHDADTSYTYDWLDNYQRTAHILDAISPDSYEPYWSGYNAAYVNMMRPEVLAIFQEVSA